MNLKYIKGNAHEIDFLHVILKNYWDVIVDFMVYSTSSFRERIDLLLRATSQYIFLSSARIYADSELLITEKSLRLLDVSHDTEYLSTDDYSLAKARQEDILKNSNYKNWTIIRPYITYDTHRLQLGVLEKEEWLYRALKGRTIVLSKEINSKITTLTHGLDVAKAIMNIIGNPNALSDVFHVSVKNSFIWNDILDIYLEILEKYIGYKPKVLLLDMERFIECKPAKYQIIYDRLYNRQFDNSKISQYINIDYFTKINEGLKYCLNEFLKKPEFDNINWKLEALKDKQTHERTPLKEIDSIKQKIKYLFYRYL
jgi:nucleoside-diphosphate-sugar epimerase